MRRCTMFAVLTCTAPAALGLAPGTWAGSQPRARRVVSVEAPPPAGFVWGYASDESEQLASTAKVPIAGENDLSDHAAEATHQQSSLQEQGPEAAAADAADKIKAATVLPQLRLAALRKEGEAVIARREAVGEMLESALQEQRLQAAAVDELRLATLRKEGEAVIARREAVGEMLERRLRQRQAPKTVWPEDDAWIGVLGAGLGGPVDEWGKQLPPTWADLTQVPVRVPNQAAWKSLGKAKQLAILCRLSVVHLTVISCGVPCMLAAATGSATGLVVPLVWIVTLSLWHLSQNLINDVQDLQRGLDRVQYAFRLQYSSHPLAVMPAQNASRDAEYAQSPILCT